MIEVEVKDKFFVWTKKGCSPSFAHETHAAAFAEAERLAIKNPGRKFIVQHWLEKVSVGVQQKEPAMQHKIWAGAKDNQVAFARNENSLTEQGFNNPRSFTVEGTVNGLSLIDDEQQQTQPGSPQTA